MISICFNGVKIITLFYYKTISANIVPLPTYKENSFYMINVDFFQLQRFPSHEVIIGDRPVGGQQPIRLQSMTNTNTLDINATIAQSIRIIEAGADYVRISAPNLKAAEALKDIRAGIKKAGFTNPLIADIHFNADVALTAAQYVSKIRINPGNYTGGIGAVKTEYSPEDTYQEKERILLRLKPLVEVCKENGTAIRIGTNLGSLSPRIISQYGNTPLGMVNATYEFLEIFRELNFSNLVISLKASKPLIMVEAYENMVEKMLENDMSYPLHIGITEAGEGENGRIKSALGICSLLNKGIGDTVRVSLTEDPEMEIPFAKKLTSIYQVPFSRPFVDYGFRLQKSDFYQDNIPVKVKNLKAIVIADVLPAFLQRWGNSINDGEEKQAREADFYFTKDVQLAEKWKDQSFIIPLSLWTPHHSQHIIPMAEMSQGEGNYQRVPDGKEFFLRICCHETAEPNCIEVKKNLLGIILDMNSCHEEIEVSHWMDFSQKNNLPLIIRKSFSTTDANELISHISTFGSNALLEKRIQGLWVKAPAIGEVVLEIVFGFLQSTGLRITRTEFISCPTCARTSYNLQQVLKEVQKHTSHLPGLKIAVMGCIVNGPGEMADADFGFVGTGNGKLHLYKGRNVVMKNIEPSNATAAILGLLHENGF